MGLRLNCAVAARCGGCLMANMDYADQLARKQKTVTELLAPFGAVSPILSMKNPFHYRNKVHAAFAANKRGDIISGVYEAGSHRVVPVERCAIEDEGADAIIADIRALMRDFDMRPYNEYTHRGVMRHVMIRAARQTGQYLVALVTGCVTFPSAHAFTSALIKKHPEITTVVQNINTRDTSMVLGTHERVLYGPGYIEDILCGKRFRLSPQSFYQVNSVQTEVLYQKAIELAALTPNDIVMDAYCGIGTIGLVAADACKRVYGVELNEQAVADARINAALNHTENTFFVQGDAGRKMREWALQGRKPDVVMMDPPRAGSDTPFLSALCAMSPKRVVYVSCNPETLARDLAFLVKNGYRMLKAVPVDMFPFTAHVETVVLLCKGETNQKPMFESSAKING